MTNDDVTKTDLVTDSAVRHQNRRQNQQKIQVERGPWSSIRCWNFLGSTMGLGQIEQFRINLSEI